MSILIPILTFLIFISCGQQSNKKSLPKQSTNLLNAKPTDFEKKNIGGLDSIVTNAYVITFQDTKPFAQTDIYGDLGYRINLTDTIDNWYDRAKKIQDYLQVKFSDYFTTSDSSLILNLASGQNLTFPVWDNEKDEGFGFEYYFKEIDYYLLRVQWIEGNCWLMVNRQNGFQRYICGLPYINKNKFLTINTDLDAGYSFNGMEFYSLINDTLKNEFSEKTTWGPVDIKWINDSQFLVKREHFYIDSIKKEQNNKFDYKLATIKNKIKR
jgi:hypothetical protein